MNISSISHSVAAFSLYNGNSLPLAKAASTEQGQLDAGHSSQKVNLRDISIDEINSLIKSGRTELLDVVPFIPIHVLQQYNYDATSIGNHRMNLLGQVENSIQFNQSIGQNTTFLEAVMTNLKKIDGTYYPAKIDTMA